MNLTKTEYGYKRTGRNKYVIVAPHGAGDDLKTAEIADKVAELLEAGAVVNTKYRRREHDLNDITDLATNKIKKEFYADIKELAQEARKYAAGEYDGKKHALIIYIHGMADRQDLGIDLGIGVKWNKTAEKYLGAREHPQACGKKGKIRANIEMTRNLRLKLDQELKEERGKRAGIGKTYPGWDENNGIQYHAGTLDHSLQIEICRTLRKEPEYIAGKIAEALQHAYQRL